MAQRHGSFIFTVGVLKGVVAFLKISLGDLELCNRLVDLMMVFFIIEHCYQLSALDGIADVD